MRTELKRAEVEIDGDRYTVRTELDPELAQKIALYVDQRIQQIRQSTSIISSSKIAILAALNIAEELFVLKLQKGEMEQVVEEKSVQMLNMLDELISKGQT